MPSVQEVSFERHASSHTTSNAYRAPANSTDNWTAISDLAERQRIILNGFVQRNYRNMPILLQLIDGLKVMYRGKDQKKGSKTSSKRQNHLHFHQKSQKIEYGQRTSQNRPGKISITWRVNGYQSSRMQNWSLFIVQKNVTSEPGKIMTVLYKSVWLI